MVSFLNYTIKTNSFSFRLAAEYEYKEFIFMCYKTSFEV
jgi:hypothetical protein